MKEATAEVLGANDAAGMKAEAEAVARSKRKAVLICLFHISISACRSAIALERDWQIFRCACLFRIYNEWKPFLQPQLQQFMCVKSV